LSMSSTSTAYAADIAASLSAALAARQMANVSGEANFSRSLSGRVGMGIRFVRVHGLGDSIYAISINQHISAAARTLNSNPRPAMPVFVRFVNHHDIGWVDPDRTMLAIESFKHISLSCGGGGIRHGLAMTTFSVSRSMVRRNTFVW